MDKQKLLEAAPKFCKWCKENDEVEWTEFTAVFGERFYIDARKIVGSPLGDSLSCECTRCGSIVEVRHDEENA